MIHLGCSEGTYLSEPYLNENEHNLIVAVHLDGGSEVTLAGAKTEKFALKV